jgi:tetratricopeptide (TPR) repeat protein
MRRSIFVVALACAFVVVAHRARADGAAPVDPTSADAICGRAAKLQSVAEYDRAAELYTACAKRFPDDRRADAALSDAVILRLGLGDREEAIRLANEYLKTYGATRPARAAVVTYAVAQSHVEHEEWRRAGEVLARHERLLASAPIDIRILAHMAKARVLLHGAKPELADAELAAARALYGKGDVLEPEIARAYPDEDVGQRMKRLAKSLTAVGDAFVIAIDHERDARLGPLRTHFEERRAAIESLESRYQLVLELRPLPPPKAVVESAGAVAKMWTDLADDMARSVPLEARTILRQHALPAARACVAFSVKYEFTNERSQACDAWLVKNDAERFHPLPELAPQPHAHRQDFVAEGARRP